MQKIMPRVKEEYGKLIKQEMPVNISEMLTNSKKSSSDGIVVEGIDNCLIKLSRCCDPLPGDDIIGFITRGHGVSIHKCDCNNVPKDMSKCEEPERWIAAHWENNRSSTFKCHLQLCSVDRPALLADVSMAIAGMHVPLHSVNARQDSSGNAVIDITVSVESVEHLNSIIKRIERIEGVINVERFNG